MKPSSYIENLSANHPVRIYFEENSYLKSLIAELNQIDPEKEKDF